MQNITLSVTDMLKEDLKSVYDQINIADAHFSTELYLPASFWLQS